MEKVFNNKIWAIGRLPSNTNIHFFDNGGSVIKTSILLKIKNTVKTTAVNMTCYVFSFGDLVVCLEISNPSGILTIRTNASNSIVPGSFKKLCQALRQLFSNKSIFCRLRSL